MIWNELLRTVRLLDLMSTIHSQNSVERGLVNITTKAFSPPRSKLSEEIHLQVVSHVVRNLQ
jgi:hypothetical protein